ncbi:PqqD family protein [Methanosarcina barkeri]|uniref:PqqD family protein n=1 Tax=Methanosarcina barkeri TaxID=2208 RepID=UPI0006CFD368|nr:PqqD family protein [Methanosarcina barkeri]
MKKSKKIFKINNSAKKVIDLLDNVNTVGDVINKIAINYGISLKEARIKCNRLFTELLNNDIVGIANSTGSIPRLDPTFGRST